MIAINAYGRGAARPLFHYHLRGMDRLRSVLSLLLLVGCLIGTAQPPDTLTSRGDTVRTVRESFLFPELCFSNAFDPGGEPGPAGPVRFTALSLESYFLEGLSRHFGVYGGLGWRHVGFIRSEPDTTITYKYRTWNLSASAGVALGDLKGGFLFTGMTLELPFQYRERRFEDGEKVDAYSAWFSDRTRSTSQAVVFGYQAPIPLSIKCMYYLNPFFRARSIQDRPGVHVGEVGDYDPHVFSISVQLGLFSREMDPRPLVNGPG